MLALSCDLNLSTRVQISVNQSSLFSSKGTTPLFYSSRNTIIKTFCLFIVMFYSSLCHSFWVGSCSHFLLTLIRIYKCYINTFLLTENHHKNNDTLMIRTCGASVSSYYGNDIVLKTKPVWIHQYKYSFSYSLSLCKVNVGVVICVRRRC